MILVLPSATGTLSLGTSGMPRQVRNCEPNRLTVGGGTPRRVHSRPKAAMRAAETTAMLEAETTAMLAAETVAMLAAEPADRRRDTDTDRR